MTIVMKFGGSSVADAEKIRHCAHLVRETAGENRVVTVVSAMGGVTDMLLDLANAAAAGNRVSVHTLLGRLHDKHTKAAETLGAVEPINMLLHQLDALISGISAVGELTARSRDAVVSHGERMCAILTAAALKGRALTGHEAGIVTNDKFGDADPLMELTRFQVQERVQPLLDSGQWPVVTGFLGATQHGVTTTLGRGGSDYTAAILGAALPADEIWIWSDVDGLLAADPRIVPDVQRLESVTFAEAIEMGQFGAKSMHPRALEPAAENRIPVRMRNTFHVECPGTRIVEDAPPGHIVRAVLRVNGSAMIMVTGAAMIGRPGTAARVFAALADAGVNIQVISQSVSEAGISMVIPSRQVERARAALESKLVRTGIARHVDVDEHIDVVAVIGAEMRGTPGVATRVFGALARNEINVIAISQGSSELSICFVVREDAGPTAVRALHEEFGLRG